MSFAAVVLLALAPAASVRLDSCGDVAALAQKLKSGDALDRRQAVLDLAADGTPAAWPHIVDALRDADPMVADEAQIQLGNLTDMSVAKGLLAKDGLSSTDAWVRARSAEALGRMKLEFDGAALCRHMGDKDPELRRLVAWTIERLARAGHIDGKSKRFTDQELENVMKKDSDPNVRAAALCARHAVDPLPVSHLIEILGAKETGIVRSAATHLLAAVDATQLPEIVGAYVSSDDVCVRQAYVRELARTATRDNVHRLVLRLAYEKNVRVTWTMVEILQNLSGEMLKNDAAKWLEWETKQSADWKPKGPAFVKDAKHEYDTGGTAFMDMPLLSNHFAVLFDFSESMWSKLGSGKTRKDAVEFELRHLLEHLPAGSEFNLIPYADVPAPWEKGLAPANAANVKRALAYFKECKTNGKGNFWDAAMLALSDPKIDTIILVSNGEPAGGHHWNLELIRNLFAEKNRFHHVALDALILGTKPEVLDVWKDLCAQNGGRMLAVDMK
jgi:HEAT repeat protein